VPAQLHTASPWTYYRTWEQPIANRATLNSWWWWRTVPHSARPSGPRIPWQVLSTGLAQGRGRPLL